MYLEKKQIFPVIVIGTLQFVILTIIAMMFYTGGTRIDKTTEGYNFFTNFLSDLGRTTTYSREGNLVSVILFVLALTGLGVTFLAYFRIIPEIFNQNEMEEKLGKIIANIGTIAAFTFMGVAVTPANLVAPIHDALVVTGFSLVAILLGLLLVLTLNDPKFSKFYTLTYILLIIVILAYGGLFFLIPEIITYNDLLIRVTMQKVVVYSLLLCFLIQSYGIWRYRIVNLN